MAEAKDKCVEPAKGIMLPEEESSGKTGGAPREVVPVRVGVGKKAPDFEVNAYLDSGFQNIKLSDYFGQWLVLCFYPGDFTFV